jgi:hypothetical protein
MISSARAWVVVLFAALLHGCATLVPTPPAPEANVTISQSQAEQAWARVLDRFVDNRGRVDFAGLARTPQDLHTIVRYVARTPIDSVLAGQPRLAYFINAYNALSMFNVISLGIPASNQSLFARYNFFIARTFEIGGTQMSLYDFENKIIRAIGEPRIHWALNCSAVSCPTLPRVPFSAANLDAELDREAKSFFNDTKHLRVDHTTKEIWLSEIFKLFPEDFVPKHAKSFTEYASRYTSAPLPQGYAERIIPYDWTIANQSLK